MTAGTVNDIASVTFLSTISARIFEIPDATGPGASAVISSVNGGSISASSRFFVGANTTIGVDQASALLGPGSSSNVGFDDYGVIKPAGFSQLAAYELIVFGTLGISSELVKPTTLDVASYNDPFLTESGSVAVGGDGRIADTLGIVGNSASNNSTTLVDGRRWDNQQLLVGGARTRG